MVTITEKVVNSGIQDDKPDDNSSECLSKLFCDIKESQSQLEALIDDLKEQVSSGKLNSNDGISLLDVKNQMMFGYLTNVVYIIAKKCHGQSIEGDAAVDRLVEMRTVLERIRPVEHKLKYMMEKLVKAALTGITDDNDPTHFRANPANMDDNEADSDSEPDKAEETTGKKSGVYVPPRLAPMHYDEQETVASKRQKQVERAKKRALHSSVMEELREEYLETPTEVTHGNALKATLTRHQRHKHQYEEEYFTRLPTSKKDRHRGRHSMTVGNIGDQLTHFDNIQVLEDEATFSATNKRKRKSTGKPSKKKGFKKRKVH